MAKRRDRLYASFASIAEAAAGRLWATHREELSATGVEMDDMLQQARLDLLEMISTSLDSDHAGAAFSTSINRAIPTAFFSFMVVSIP